MRIWKDNIRMDLEEILINTRNWVDSAQNKYYWESYCEFSTEPIGFISHGVSYTGCICSFWHIDLTTITAWYAVDFNGTYTN
jgi:hypothetical protein